MSSPFRIGQPVLAYSGSIIYSAIVVRIQRRANAFCYFVHCAHLPPSNNRAERLHPITPPSPSTPRRRQVGRRVQ